MQSPWSLHRNGAKSLIPKISSARGSPMPAGIGRRGRIARASPIDERGSIPLSSIMRGQYCRLRCYWNYVGRHAADEFSTVTPTDCPVDSRVAIVAWATSLPTILSCFKCSAVQNFDHQPMFRSSLSHFAERNTVTRSHCQRQGSGERNTQYLIIRQVKEYAQQI